MIGGIAAGAIIAGATRPYYAPGYAYGPPYGYYDPAYTYGPAYAYGPGYYGYYGYGRSTADYTNMDRQLQGTR